MFHRKRVEEGKEPAVGQRGIVDGSNGRLPFHHSSILEVRELVQFNPERRELWRQMEAFLAEANLSRDFSNLFLTGPFVSSNKEPHEIDAVLQTRASYGTAAFAALQPFFAMGLETIRARYAVNLRFWIEGAPWDWSALSDSLPDGSRRPLATVQGLLRHGLVCIPLGTALESEATGDDELEGAGAH